MSRIGIKPISFPDSVSVTVADGSVVVKGPKGELSTQILPGIKVAVSSGEVEVSRNNDLKQTKAFHGLIRSLIANNVSGVTDGYKKTLKMVGTGYRVKAAGQGLSLSVGYSHNIDVLAREGVDLKVEGNNTIYIEGIDKQAVGQMAAEIRKLRPPEPYKGKGIRYEGEVVKRKQGKVVAATT